MTTISLKPSEIRYSQDSISNRFQYSYKLIGETLDDICEKRLKVQDIPNIRVKKIGNYWYTFDNRRLWVFRHLERLGKCGRIEVEDMTKTNASLHVTTTCDGSDVEVRGGDPGGKWYNSYGGIGFIGKSLIIGAVILGFRALTRT